VCRREVLSTTTRHSDTSTRSRRHQRRPISDSKRQTAAAAVSARTSRRIGRIFQRPVDASAQQPSCASLSSIGHLRTGRYYRWNPDISNIRPSENARTVVCKSSVDVSDSAASQPWQHVAFLCSDGDSTEVPLDVTSACPHRQVRDSDHVVAAGDDRMTGRSEACRRLYVVETSYSDEMADGVVEFVRPLCAAVLSQSDNNTLFQNVEKVRMSIIRSHRSAIRSTYA